MNTQIDSFWKLLSDSYLRQLKICISDAIKLQVCDLVPVHEKSCSYVNPETILCEKHIPRNISKLLRVDDNAHAFITEFTKWYIPFFYGLIKSEIRSLIVERGNSTKLLDNRLNVVKVNKSTNDYDVKPCFYYNDILDEYAQFKHYNCNERFVIVANSVYLVNLDTLDYKKFANLSSMVKALNFGSKFFRILSNSQLVDYLEKRQHKKAKKTRAASSKLLVHMNTQPLAVA